MSMVVAGCAVRGPAQWVPPYKVEARLTRGEVRVAEVIVLHRVVEPTRQDWIGEVSERRMQVRERRSREVGEVAMAVGRALPGEINGALGPQWHGHFTDHRLPSPSRHHLEDALRYRRELDQTLAGAAQRMGGDTALFSWVDEIRATPLSLMGPPGSVVSTRLGLSVVDPTDEPHLVSARVGMALVAADGEVVLRYQQTYETILSAAWGPEDAGRALARALATEVSDVWALDPRLAAIGRETAGTGAGALAP
jgi:hypothetical protein